MDMYVEQKYLNIGGGCKVSNYVCTKCSLSSNDFHYYWKDDYKAELCNVCDHMNSSNNEKLSFRCMHKNVNDQIEIDTKRINLSMILQERNDDNRENEFENEPHLLFDPSMHDKFINPYHIDFDYVNYKKLEGQQSNNDVVLKNVQVFRDLIHSINAIFSVIYLKKSFNNHFISYPNILVVKVFFKDLYCNYCY